MSKKKKDITDLLKAAITKATSDFRKEKRTTNRREELSRSARQRLYVRHYAPMSVRRASFRVMEEAYMKASANNTLPANARQIMYQARPLIQKLTTKMWKDDSLFTQNYLPRYLRDNSTKTANWDVVYDARGHFEEPHTETRVDLGTLAVRGYVQNWTSKVPDTKIDPIDLEMKTHGPANRYKFALFIEKEGFTALLNHSQIGKRYDIAIMSTKGFSVTASRRLVESLSAAGVTTLVAHDFDVSGFTIYRTLQENTTRYRFARQPKVKFLGLRLTDVEEMSLTSESVDLRNDPTHELKKCKATKEEIEFLADGQRVELNAMDSAQFIHWLEGKLEEHGVEKLVPDRATLESAYKLAILTRQANAAIARVQQEWDENGHDNIQVPSDLEEQIRSRISGTELSWDEAIKDIEAPETPTSP